MKVIFIMRSITWGGTSTYNNEGLMTVSLDGFEEFAGTFNNNGDFYGVSESSGAIKYLQNYNGNVIKTLNYLVNNYYPTTCIDIVDRS